MEGYVLWILVIVTGSFDISYVRSQNQPWMYDSESGQMAAIPEAWEKVTSSTPAQPGYQDPLMEPPSLDHKSSMPIGKSAENNNRATGGAKTTGNDNSNGNFWTAFFKILLKKPSNSGTVNTLDSSRSTAGSDYASSLPTDHVEIVDIHYATGSLKPDGQNLTENEVSKTTQPDIRAQALNLLQRLLQEKIAAIVYKQKLQQVNNTKSIHETEMKQTVQDNNLNNGLSVTDNKSISSVKTRYPTSSAAVIDIPASWKEANSGSQSKQAVISENNVDSVQTPVKTDTNEYFATDTRNNSQNTINTLKIVTHKKAAPKEVHEIGVQSQKTDYGTVETNQVSNKQSVNTPTSNTVHDTKRESSYQGKNTDLQNGIVSKSQHNSTNKVTELKTVIIKGSSPYERQQVLDASGSMSPITNLISNSPGKSNIVNNVKGSQEEHIPIADIHEVRETLKASKAEISPMEPSPRLYASFPYLLPPRYNTELNETIKIKINMSESATNISKVNRKNEIKPNNVSVDAGYNSNAGALHQETAASMLKENIQKDVVPAYVSHQRSNDLSNNYKENTQTMTADTVFSSPNKTSASPVVSAIPSGEVLKSENITSEMVDNTQKSVNVDPLPIGSVSVPQINLNEPFTEQLNDYGQPTDKVVDNVITSSKISYKHKMEESPPEYYPLVPSTSGYDAGQKATEAPIYDGNNIPHVSTIAPTYLPNTGVIDQSNDQSTTMIKPSLLNLQKDNSHNSSSKSVGSFTGKNHSRLTAKEIRQYLTFLGWFVDTALRAMEIQTTTAAGAYGLSAQPEPEAGTPSYSETHPPNSNIVQEYEQSEVAPSHGQSNTVDQNGAYNYNTPRSWQAQQSYKNRYPNGEWGRYGKEYTSQPNTGKYQEQVGSANVYKITTPYVSQQVQTKSTTTTVPTTRNPCIMTPVCGDDGKTYMSQCFIPTGIIKACDGTCPCPENQTPQPNFWEQANTVQRTPGTTQYMGGQTTVKATVAPSGASTVNVTSVCMNQCPQVHEPVCSTKGNTFDSECHISCANETLMCYTLCPCEFEEVVPEVRRTFVNLDELVGATHGVADTSLQQLVPSTPQCPGCGPVDAGTRLVCSAGGRTMTQCQAQCLHAIIECYQRCPCNIEW